MKKGTKSHMEKRASKNTNKLLSDGQMDGQTNIQIERRTGRGSDIIACTWPDLQVAG
jgi:hypothetical protein